MSKELKPKLLNLAFPGTIFASAVTSEGVTMSNYQTASFLISSGKASQTAAVYTLTIAKSYEALDTITINGTVYTCVASGATGNEFVPGTAAETAGALKLLLVGNEPTFTVTTTGATVVFTQKVAGVGAIPTVETTVDAGAAIVVTTPFDDAAEDMDITIECDGNEVGFFFSEVGATVPPALVETKTVDVGTGKIYVATITSDMLAGKDCDVVVLKTTAVSGSTVAGTIICLQSNPRYSE